MVTSIKQEKLKDLNETKKIVKYQQEHYAKVLTQFDDQIAFINEQIVDHDLEIAVLQERKATVSRHYLEAPEQLIALAQQLRSVEKKESDLKTDAGDQVKKVARLKTRIEKLREKLNQIDPDGSIRNKTTS